jgi:type II secretory pathway predicted ATPase ExeA
MVVRGVLSGYSRRPAKYATAENTRKIGTAEAARGLRATTKNAAQRGGLTGVLGRFTTEKRLRRYASARLLNRRRFCGCLTLRPPS